MISVSSVQEYHTRSIMKKVVRNLILATIVSISIITVVGAKSTYHEYGLGNGLGVLDITVNWTDYSGEYEGYGSSVKWQASNVVKTVNYPTAHTYSLDFYARTAYYDDVIEAITDCRGSNVSYNSGGSSRTIK